MYGLEATDWFIISCKFSCFCAVAILKLFVVNHIPGLVLAALRFNKYLQLLHLSQNRCRSWTGPLSRRRSKTCWPRTTWSSKPPGVGREPHCFWWKARLETERRKTSWTARTTSCFLHLGWRVTIVDLA